MAILGKLAAIGERGLVHDGERSHFASARFDRYL
jgi:hypothetical protein